MKPTLVKARRRLRRAWKVVVSSLPRRGAPDAFEDVQTFCMFLGTPRSGHSLVGALIDAHPNAIVAHELNVLHYLRSGATRELIYALVLKNSQRAARAGRAWSGYSYAVPHQWQGRHAKLQVIGDKKGGSTTKQLRAHPDLLDRLGRTLRIPVRFVHVVRNPYDNISTMAQRSRRTLQASIDDYFGLCAANAALRDRLGPDGVYDLRYESLVADPRGSLRALCTWLGLEPTEDYLRDCASIVFTAPRRTRQDAGWTAPLIADVRRRMASFPVLDGYTYED